MTEDPRRRQFEALAVLDETYDEAPTGHLTTGLDGVVLRANKAFLAWTGYTGDEVVGVRSLPDFLNMGGRIYLETHFWPTLRLHGRIEEVAFDMVCKDGAVFPALVSAVQRRDHAGVALFNRISVFKATERRRYEQELLLARREAERSAEDLARAIGELSRVNDMLDQANQELSQFAHAVSHDLQAPLRTVKMYAEQLRVQHGAGLDDEAMSLIYRMTSNIGCMQGQISDLLDLSHTGIPGRHEATDLGMMVDDAVQLLAADVLAAGAVITHDPLPKIAIDRRRFAQLMRNLLANALKYRHPDRAPRIHVCAVEEPAMWRFEIRDNGLGFPMTGAERIFEPFKRLHGTGIQVAGIGLAFCRTVITAHGGRIWAESTPGEGATFCFTLPKSAR